MQRELKVAYLTNELKTEPLTFFTAQDTETTPLQLSYDKLYTKQVDGEDNRILVGYAKLPEFNEAFSEIVDPFKVSTTTAQTDYSYWITNDNVLNNELPNYSSVYNMLPITYGTTPAKEYLASIIDTLKLRTTKNGLSYKMPNIADDNYFLYSDNFNASIASSDIPNPTNLETQQTNVTVALHNSLMLEDMFNRVFLKYKFTSLTDEENKTKLTIYNTPMYYGFIPTLPTVVTPLSSAVLNDSPIDYHHGQKINFKHVYGVFYTDGSFKALRGTLPDDLSFVKTGTYHEDFDNLANYSQKIRFKLEAMFSEEQDIVSHLNNYINA